MRASQLGSEHQCADTVDSFASWPFSRSSPSSHSTARYDPGKALRDPYAQKGRRWHLPQCDRTLDVVNEEHFILVLLILESRYASMRGYSQTSFYSTVKWGQELFVPPPVSGDVAS